MKPHWLGVGRVNAAFSPNVGQSTHLLGEAFKCMCVCVIFYSVLHRLLLHPLAAINFPLLNNPLPNSMPSRLTMVTDKPRGKELAFQRKRFQDDT